jgi:hypothetical protein
MSTKTRTRVVPITAFPFAATHIAETSESMHFALARQVCRSAVETTVHPFRLKAGAPSSFSCS